MEPGVQYRIHKGFPDPILSRINPIPRIAAYLCKIHSNIVFHLRLGLPKCLYPVGFLAKMLKALLPSSILHPYSTTGDNIVYSIYN
jgi:hypothetical protein